MFSTIRFSHKLVSYYIICFYLIHKHAWEIKVIYSIEVPSNDMLAFKVEYVCRDKMNLWTQEMES